jgi:lipoprotein-releasing system ATP-binding protein
MSDLLEVRDLAKSYHDGTRELKVLRGINLTVKAGETIAVIGMSGAGKSTLLHLIGGLDRPDTGSIVFQGNDLTQWSKPKLDDFRNKSIGFVFQFHHLLPEFSALENVMMPALVARRPREEAAMRAGELLKELGLEDRASHRPAKLSGGEQQRVALARAMMNQPALLLADEPTGNLDPKTGDRVIELVWKSTAGQGRSLIIVTHEPLIAEKADRIFQLAHGKLEPIKRENLAHHMMKS